MRAFEAQQPRPRHQRPQPIVADQVCRRVVDGLDIGAGGGIPRGPGHHMIKGCRVWGAHHSAGMVFVRSCDPFCRAVKTLVALIRAWSLLTVASGRDVDGSNPVDLTSPTSRPPSSMSRRPDVGGMADNAGLSEFSKPTYPIRFPIGLSATICAPRDY